MYVISVEFVVEERYAASFGDALKQQAENSLALEADCHTFHVCVDEERANRFFLYEEYTDRPAFNAHLASAHFIDFNASVTPWVIAKQVDGWHRL